MAFKSVPRWGVHSEDTWTWWLRWSIALSPLLHSFSHCQVPREIFVCANSQSIFPSRKHDNYSESCPREVTSSIIKPVWWCDAWQTSPNFADLFLFFLEAIYVLSQPSLEHASSCVSHLCMLFSSKDLLSPKDILLWKLYYNESEFIHDADNDNLSEVT